MLFYQKRLLQSIPLLLMLTITLHIIFQNTWIINVTQAVHQLGNVSVPQLNLTSSLVEGRNNDIELTVITAGTKKLMEYTLCDFIRSASLFWNAGFGAIHFILDKDENADSKYLPEKLKQLNLPFKFKFTHIPGPGKSLLERLKKRTRGDGYYIQFYESFFLDTRTNASIIAWSDTDAIFTQPVLLEHIIDTNGKILVKGYNLLIEMGEWAIACKEFLGYPMVSDFMSYFPMYLHPSTLKNVRIYLTKRLNTKSFDDAFIKMAKRRYSPAVLIMTYAYYFEKERYIWHIDPGVNTLDEYNNKYVHPSHALTRADIKPWLSFMIHSKYYRGYFPLEQSICFLQLNLNLTAHKVCNQFKGKVNDQLYEFNHLKRHLDTWCRDRVLCDKLVNESYSKIAKLYRNKEITFRWDSIKVVEKFAKENYGIDCKPIKYESKPKPI